MVRLNTGIAATPAAQQSTFGVAGGDLAGFPNGRRPGDDVTDIALPRSHGASVPSDPVNGTPTDLGLCKPADAGGNRPVHRRCPGYCAGLRFAVPVHPHAAAGVRQLMRAGPGVSLARAGHARGGRGPRHGRRVLLRRSCVRRVGEALPAGRRRGDPAGPPGWRDAVGRAIAAHHGRRQCRPPCHGTPADRPHHRRSAFSRDEPAQSSGPGRIEHRYLSRST